jgi:hypothetical protein
VAAASYAAAMVTSRLMVIYAIVILSSAILMIGAVMLKGVFNRTTAYLGIATGVLGIDLLRAGASRSSRTPSARRCGSCSSVPDSTASRWDDC